MRGRILHAASGDGWLVQKIIAAGGDAYGVDPRTNLVEQGVRTVSDLRGEDLADHLRAVAPAGLGAIVLSGVVDGMASGERTQLLRADRPDARPRWRAGGALAEPRLVGQRGRALRGGPRAGPPAPDGHLARAARAQRVRRHRWRAAPVRPTTW